jgi:hypothetical protein
MELRRYHVDHIGCGPYIQKQVDDDNEVGYFFKSVTKQSVGLVELRSLATVKSTLEVEEVRQSQPCRLCTCIP